MWLSLDFYEYYIFWIIYKKTISGGKRPSWTQPGAGPLSNKCPQTTTKRKSKFHSRFHYAETTDNIAQNRDGMGTYRPNMYAELVRITFDKLYLLRPQPFVRCSRVHTGEKACCFFYSKWISTMFLLLFDNGFARQYTFFPLFPGCLSFTLSSELLSNVLN